MFERLKRLYNAGQLDEASIENAVKKGWITEEQAFEIFSPNDATPKEENE